MVNQLLSPKQKLVLEWIESYLSHNHTMPSRREIAEGLGLSSVSTIQQHIESLEEKGFLKRSESGEARAIQWTDRSKKHFQQVSDREDETNAFEVPHLGTIAAGYPIEVFSVEQSISVPLNYFFANTRAALRPKEVFALTVKGDSMIDEGILPNDIVVLKKANQAKSGETVAALLNGQATLKTFFKSKKAVELHPANPKYPVIQVKPEDYFEIQGILVGLLRKYF